MHIWAMGDISCYMGITLWLLLNSSYGIRVLLGLPKAVSVAQNRRIFGAAPSGSTLNLTYNDMSSGQASLQGVMGSLLEGLPGSVYIGSFDQGSSVSFQESGPL